MADISLFGLGFDYSDFERGVEHVKRAIDKIEAAFDRATKANANLNQNLGANAATQQATAQTSQLNNALTQNAAASGQATQANSQTATAIFDLVKALASGNLSATELTGALSALTNGGGAAGGAMLGLAGAAGVAAVAAAGLVVSVAATARELTDSARATGLGIEQLQLYREAAEYAGVSADTLVEAFAAYRKETGASAESFDALLQKLEAIPDAQQRLAAAQILLGDVSADTARAILALTDRHGELRQEILASGLVMGKVAATEMSEIDRKFASVKLAAEGFAESVKRSAASALVGLIDALGRSHAAMGNTGQGLNTFQGQQEVAARATANATDAITGQTSAVNGLSIALETLNFQALDRGVKERAEKIAQRVSSGIAPRVLTAAAARAVVEEDKRKDPAFADQARRLLIFQQNQKLINEAFEPPKPAAKGNRSAIRAAEAEARAIRDVLLQIEREGIEARLRVEHVANEERQRGLKERFDEGLISTRTFYNQQLTITLDGLDAQIAAIDAKRAQLERQLLDLPQDKKGSKSNTVESLRIQAQLIQLNTQEFEKQAAALKAIAENAQAYKKALGTLTGPDLSKQEQVRDTGAPPQLILDARQRLGNLRGVSARYDVLDAQLARDEVAIQNQVNAGLLNEAQAKSAILATQRRYQEALLASLEARKELALIEQDPAAVANLERQIEALRGLGQELSARAEFFRGLKAQSQTTGEQAYALGQDVRSAVRNGVVVGLREGGREGARALLDSLASALANFAAEQLTSAIFDGLSQTSLFRTPGINPNAKQGAGQTAGQSASQSLGDKISEALGLKRNDTQLRGVERHLSRIEHTLQAIERNTENAASCCRSAEERSTQATGPSLLQQILGTVAGALVSTIAGGIGGGSGGAESGPGFSGAPSGGYFTGSHGVPLRLRANGGPVTAGEPYLVGERGPELYVPNNMGYIVPNNRLPVPRGYALAGPGGGSTIIVNVHLHGVRDARGFESSAAQIANEAAKQVENAQRFR